MLDAITLYLMYQSSRVISLRIVMTDLDLLFCTSRKDKTDSDLIRNAVLLWNNVVLCANFFFISLLSACSLWLWHCLDAVHMLDYMYLDQSRCFISFHWSITLIVCTNKHFQSNNFFLLCSHFLTSSCSSHFTLSFSIVIFLSQFKYFSSTLALRFFQSWW